MKLVNLLFPACLLGSAVLLPAADPAIEQVIRKTYDQILKGNPQGVLACCHPEIGKFKGSFDTGYSAGRSGSLGELPNLAHAVVDKEKVTIAGLKIELVKEEGDRAIAWAKYRITHERPNSLEMAKGQMVKESWDAKDYIILKKHKGEWRLRRLEDRAGHWLDVSLQQPTADPFGGVK